MTACHLNAEDSRASGNDAGDAHDRRPFNARMPVRGRVAMNRHEYDTGALERRWPFQVGWGMGKGRGFWVGHC